MHATVRTAWKVDDYCASLQKKCRGTNERVERELQDKFPPVHDEIVLHASPMLVTDCDGKILVWYLPGILGSIAQVSGP